MATYKLKQIASTDSELWDLIREGNELAYTQLIRKYSKPLFNYGYRIFQDKDFVKDCVQDVFFEVWNRRSTIKSTPAVKWYLFKALRLRIFREQSRWAKSESLDDSYDFLVDFSVESKLITDFEKITLNNRIEQVLNNLPSRQKEILYLRFYENLDFDSISQMMDISKQSVHNLLQKAYKSFRTEWGVLVIVFINLKSVKF